MNKQNPEPHRFTGLKRRKVFDNSSFEKPRDPADSTAPTIPPTQMSSLIDTKSVLHMQARGELGTDQDSLSLLGMDQQAFPINGSSLYGGSSSFDIYGQDQMGIHPTAPTEDEGGQAWPAADGKQFDMLSNIPAGQQGEDSDDNLPFQTEDDMLQGQKEVALIKNKQAARKYRAKKKAEQEKLLDKLELSESLRSQLQIENAGLRAENTLLKKQLGYFENLLEVKSRTTQPATTQEQTLATPQKKQSPENSSFSSSMNQSGANSSVNQTHSSINSEYQSELTDMEAQINAETPEKKQKKEKRKSHKHRSSSSKHRACAKCTTQFQQPSHPDSNMAFDLRGGYPYPPAPPGAYQPTVMGGMPGAPSYYYPHHQQPEFSEKSETLVLGRREADGGPQSKAGFFALGLAMVVCCMSQLMNGQGLSSDSNAKAVPNSPGGGRHLMNVDASSTQKFDNMELFRNATDGAEEVATAEVEKPLVLPPAMLIFMALILAVLIYVTSCSLFFPNQDTYRKQQSQQVGYLGGCLDRAKQIASRKPWLRKLFKPWLRDVKLKASIEVKVHDKWT